MNSITFPCPQCGKPVEVPEADAGSTRPCPACEEWVLVPDREEAELEQAPSEPRPKATSSPTQPPPAPRAPDKASPDTQRETRGQRGDPPKRSSALGGAWSCLVTGLLLMYFAAQAHLVYLPLFAVAFILGVVALAQGKAIGGQLVLVLSLLAPVVLGVHVLGLELPEWARIPGITDVRGTAEEEESGTESNRVEEIETEPVASAWAPAAVDRTATDSANQWGGTGMDSHTGDSPATDWGTEPAPEETDWRERYQHWFEQYSDRFKAPAAGVQVTLELRSGVKAEGTLLHVGLDEVILKIPNGSVTYERERLAEPTRRKYFREDYARYGAQRRVQAERDANLPLPAQPRADPPPQPQPKQPARGFGDFL